MQYLLWAIVLIFLFSVVEIVTKFFSRSIGFLAANDKKTNICLTGVQILVTGSLALFLWFYDSQVDAQNRKDRRVQRTMALYETFTENESVQRAVASAQLARISSGATILKKFDKGEIDIDSLTKADFVSGQEQIVLDQFPIRAFSAFRLQVETINHCIFPEKNLYSKETNGSSEGRELTYIISRDEYKKRNKNSPIPIPEYRHFVDLSSLEEFVQEVSQEEFGKNGVFDLRKERDRGKYNVGLCDAPTAFVLFGHVIEEAFFGTQKLIYCSGIFEIDSRERAELEAFIAARIMFLGRDVMYRSEWEVLPEDEKEGVTVLDDKENCERDSWRKWAYISPQILLERFLDKYDTRVGAQQN